jgi:hypothetical protein
MKLLAKAVLPLCLGPPIKTILLSRAFVISECKYLILIFYTESQKIVDIFWMGLKNLAFDNNSWISLKKV